VGLRLFVSADVERLASEAVRARRVEAAAQQIA